MLFIEKYAPKTFDEIQDRYSILSLLKSFRTSTVPNVIFCGQSGFGKKTLVDSFMNFLFCKNITKKTVTTTISTGTKEISISYFESDEIIEISPADYGNQDKNVIQTLIKDLAQTRSITSLVKPNNHCSTRFIILNRAESLTKDAQAALRRTIEKYSENFRLFLLCQEINTLIEPLKSRCITVRVPALSIVQIQNRLNYILSSERCCLSKDKVMSISIACRGNLRKAICLTESVCTFPDDLPENQSKKMKIASDVEVFLEYEKVIFNICESMNLTQSADNIIQIRKDLYSLLSSCIPAKIILLLLSRHLLKSHTDFQKKLMITEAAALCAERLQSCFKEIIHLEYFVVLVMSQL